MSVLSDSALRAKLRQQSLVIKPFNEARLGPASYDLTLQSTIWEPRVRWHERLRRLVRLRRGLRLDRETYEGRYVHFTRHNPYWLKPGKFILASTFEMVGLDSSIVGRLEGKSSLARLGLFIHVTAGFVDPGFHGTLTLEVINVGPEPLCLVPGMPIAQLSVIYVGGPVLQRYGSEGLNSKYQGQVLPQPSMYFKNFSR